MNRQQSQPYFCRLPLFMLFFGFVHFWTLEVMTVGKRGGFCQVSEPNHCKVSSASSTVLRVHIWQLFFVPLPVKIAVCCRDNLLLLYFLVASSSPKVDAASWQVLENRHLSALTGDPALGPLGTMVWGSEQQVRCKTASVFSRHQPVDAWALQGFKCLQSQVIPYRLGEWRL